MTSICKRTFWLAVVLIAGLVSGNARADDPAPAKEAVVDLVICLDISGSMDGLIASAKNKLWDIVNDLAKAKPSPKLRVAIYSYGCDTYDAKTGWVRKDLDFSTDLDKVNEKLFALRTNGGTEYVARVCKAALDQLDWSKDAKALKIIYVCGNEPANQDKQVKLADVAQQAVKAGVYINSIYCGSAGHPEAAGWREFSLLAEGQYAAIDQQKAVAVINTPFDKDLAQLGGKLNDTFCFGGKEAEALKQNQVAQDANAAAQGAGVIAARTASKASALYTFKADLVEQALKDKNFDVTKVADAELPENLKKMTKDERATYIKDLCTKREAVQKQIQDLSQKREVYLREETARQAKVGGQASLDDALRQSLREQAQRKGISISK